MTLWCEHDTLLMDTDMWVFVRLVPIVCMNEPILVKHTQPLNHHACMQARKLLINNNVGERQPLCQPPAALRNADKRHTRCDALLRSSTQMPKASVDGWHH